MKKQVACGQVLKIIQLVVLPDLSTDAPDGISAAVPPYHEEHSVLVNQYKYLFSYLCQLFCHSKEESVVGTDVIHRVINHKQKDKPDVVAMLLIPVLKTEAGRSL